jgi:RNA polymerase sigma-70 factor, ECF subfamily
MHTTVTESLTTNTNAVDVSEDALLVARLLSDSPDAWRLFNKKYSRLIHSCILRVTSRFGSVVCEEDHREIFANLCLLLLANDKHRLRMFDPTRGVKLTSWVGMLATHAAYDYLRTVKRTPRMLELDEASDVEDDQDPAELTLLRERAHILTRLMAEFSAKDREFLELYFGQGLTPERIAERMHIHVKTVYSKKHKILTRLEALLAEQRLAA